MVIAILLIIVSLFCVSMGYYLATRIVHPRTFPYEKSYRVEVENGRLNEQNYASWEKEEVQIASQYGYTLSATYFPIAASNKTVILSHGITYTRLGMAKYIPIFQKQGFNVLIYDLRYHGKSGGANCTFGFYEKHDLQTLVDWCLNRLGGIGTIGSMGESLGAAIALQHGTIDPRVAFIISDCSFSRLSMQVAYRIRQEFHLPAFPFIQIGSFFCQLLAGMKFTDIEPIGAVAKIKAPILFIHTQMDTYIPAQMSMDLFNAKKTGPRQLYLAPNGNHIETYWQNRKAYEAQVEQFLKGII